MSLTQEEKTYYANPSEGTSLTQSPRREPTDEELVWNYCENYGVRSRGALVPHAPAVFVIARLEGIRGAAKYFAETLSTKITKKQVEGILSKIRKGEIKCTEGDIRLAAQAHPRANAYFKMYPSALSPRTRMEDEEEIKGDLEDSENPIPDAPAAPAAEEEDHQKSKPVVFPKNSVAESRTSLNPYVTESMAKRQRELAKELYPEEEE
jgi:hypothetical protein